MSNIFLVKKSFDCWSLGMLLIQLFHKQFLNFFNYATECVENSKHENNDLNDRDNEKYEINKNNVVNDEVIENINDSKKYSPMNSNNNDRNNNNNESNNSINNQKKNNNKDKFHDKNSCNNDNNSKFLNIDDTNQNDKDRKSTRLNSSHRR